MAPTRASPSGTPDTDGARRSRVHAREDGPFHGIRMTMRPDSIRPLSPARGAGAGSRTSDSHCA